MTWSARTTRTRDLWSLRRDGIEVGTISLLPDATRRRQLLIDIIVDALNHPPRPQRFEGPAAVYLDAARARRRAQPPEP